MRVSPEEHQIQLQSTMQEKVLESATYPEIRFISQSIRPVGERRWLVAGDLALHGKTKTIQVDVEQRGEEYSGETAIKRTDFGIRPVSAAGGTVRVKNEPGSLAQVMTVIANNGGNIFNMKVVDRNPLFFEFVMDIEVRDVAHLQNIVGALRVNNAVESVDRVRDAEHPEKV